MFGGCMIFVDGRPVLINKIRNRVCHVSKHNAQYKIKTHELKGNSYNENQMDTLELKLKNATSN